MQGGSGAGRRGRWRSGSVNRQRILEVAAERFAADGFQRSTIKAIAADAGVDTAMIHYFFGSKQGLYDAILNRHETIRDPVAELLADGLEHFGERLVRRFLQVNENNEPGDRVAALVRMAVVDPEPAALLRDFIETEFTPSLARHLDLPDARVRAGLISAQLVGVAVTRHQLRIEPLTSASPETIVALVAPIIQRLLTDPLPIPVDGDQEANVTGTSA
ncbi:TetR/AcrR family transcriptional regulator [Nonomuraea longispora]|uniref:TetR/AcrR family transcriptional regulator n=1 Tax=Nonomuraea longispora TaxID=1848320 RepID=A0A4R4N8D3_9ACTN|nr:TetR family transcriptional regulator [Nonomuraea longispora]TDC03187.1 TetR/AcrR family transcriptional regulator [Nonomuraea longispora]